MRVVFLRGSTPGVWVSRLWVVLAVGLVAWLLGHETVGALPVSSIANQDVSGAARAPEQRGRPLAGLLREDGTLDLSTGYQGAIDPTGWRLVRGTAEAPRFVPEGTTPDDGWADGFGLPGLYGEIEGMAVYRGSLYVGGGMDAIGTAVANNIARWDGITWSPLISGTANGVNGGVNTLMVYSDTLIVGGSFDEAGGQPANNIASWDGVRWSLLISGTANGVNDGVEVLDVYSGTLIAAGTFDQAGGQSVNGIASWDGVRWAPLGTPGSDGVSGGGVLAITVYSDSLYAGGYFNTAGGQPANFIARWDGVGWSPLISDTANGVNDHVYSLAIYNDALYAGGRFNTAGGQEANRIARWDGVSWSPLISGTDNGVNSPVTALTVYSDGLAVGGNFTLPTDYVALWDGISWSPLVSGTAGSLDGTVESMLVYSGTLVVVGSFQMASGQPASGIASWDGMAWSPLVSGIVNGVNGGVYAMAIYSDSLYIGGGFTQAGQQVAHNIARWNGVTWSPLISGTANGVNGSIEALTVYRDALVLGGYFTYAGGQPANNVALWDGVTWSPLISGTANGVNGPILSAEVYSDVLFVGGAFLHAGGAAAQNIASWDGSRWWPLGSGVNSTVLAMEVYSDALYVGGYLEQAGGQPVNRIARWDGVSWSPLISGTAIGVGGAINDLVVYQDELYAVGSFSNAGGQPANHIARWDGVAWSPLISGTVNGVQGFNVNTLAVFNDALYVGGDLSQAGGLAVHNIARWDGAAWSPLGSGIGRTVSILAIDTLGRLWVGGNFRIAGDKPSSSVARWTEANLQLAKWATPGVVDVGQMVTYTLVVTNSGPSLASEVRLTDVLPMPLTFAIGSMDCGGAEVVTCTLASLAPNEVATVTLVVMATEAGVFTNTATVAAAAFDPDITNNSASAVTTVNMVNPPQADLHLAKWASSADVYAGESLTYTLVVTNSGPDVASEVRLTDVLPLPLTFAIGSMECGGTSVVTCTLPSLAPNEVATMTLVVMATEAGVFTNTATVTSATFDPNMTNNSASAATTVSSLQADLHLAKWATPESVYVGEMLTYTLVVTNSGPDVANQVRLTDVLPLPLTFAIGSMDCGGTSVVTCTLESLAPN